MTHKAGTLNVLWSDGNSNSQAHKRVMTVALSLLAMALVVASIYLLVSTPSMDAGSGTMVGVEVNSARWAALGAANAPDYEAVAAASSARWSALGAAYGQPQARLADAARWSAVGAAFAPDYGAIAAVNSARYAALAAHYGLSQARLADAARWSAVGAAFAPDYEAIAAFFHQENRARHEAGVRTLRLFHSPSAPAGNPE
jgi:ABC-type enterobactin transport system permease subunit